MSDSAQARRSDGRPRPRRAVTPGALRLVRRRLRRAGFGSLQCSAANGAVRLEGSLESWDDRVSAGYIAASVQCRGVVNDVSVPGVNEPPPRVPRVKDSSLEGRQFDVAIVGGGLIGCAAARELSRYDLRIVVLEKEDDVGAHASSRNDGMIHPGFAPRPGTFRAWYNATGNRLYAELAPQLGFRFKRVGSIMLFSSWWVRLLLPVMWWRVARNKVAGPVRYLRPREVRRMEPNVTVKQRGGLHFPSTGIVNPFEVTIAFAENAQQNGVEFSFETVATGFESGGEPGLPVIERVHTNRGTISAAVVINAAGGWADRVAELAGDRFFTIHGRRGMDVVLDKRYLHTQRCALAMPDIMKLSHTHSKGGGLIPSIDGNLIAGPTASETADREDYSTSPAEFDQVTGLLGLNRAVSSGAIITYFAGVRSATFTEDFIVGQSRLVANLIHVAGIQSPGLASAPAIAVEVAGLTLSALAGTGSVVRERPDFAAVREPRKDLSALTLDERAQLIASRPDYGRPVCRCEDVTEGEIRDALRSPLGVRSVDAVKRRTRAGAGRCHGGFCLPKLLEIIHDETGIPMEGIRKKSGDSFLVLGRTKTMERWKENA